MCNLIGNENKFSASAFAKLKSLQKIICEWNNSLRVSPGPHWGFYLRRATQTESEHKICWTAATWLAILSLVATLEHKNLGLTAYCLCVFKKALHLALLMNVSQVGSFESVVFENWRRKLNLEMVDSCSRFRLNYVGACGNSTSAQSFINCALNTIP